MARYRSKIVEISAEQWNGESPDKWGSLLKEALKECKLAYVEAEKGLVYLSIETAEGTMRAHPGDYIIRGLIGEYYPCKAEVFEQKYEFLHSGPRTYGV